MIPELGHYALILALCVAIVQTVFPLIGAANGNRNWTAVAIPATRAQLVMVAIAYACLTYAFVVSDFSVKYVATNSNIELPLIYRISGVWGAHEGSMLLWVLILAVWSGAVSVFSRSVPQDMVARVLGVMGLVSIGFLLFVLLTSNPFERFIPPAPNGRDLNPLLQDIGLAIHPPLLYMGYVGFSVAFAFAVAAMLSGRLDTAWARWSRPWTNVAWLFLTLGIALGSWWAYYELGWGGWWFWDPVENASFMPWLVGTALMHSLAATEKRGVFKAWTVLLAVTAFSLSLLGAFLVRSGVLTSVHAFATDPERGVFILAFLAVVVGGSLSLYAWRAPQIRSRVSFALVSRESGLLLNNVLFVVVAATVLLGTLYPLVLDALGLGKLSVGPPYFNTVFIPLTVPLAAAVGIGAMARWKRDNISVLLRQTRLPLAASLIAGLALPLAAPGDYSWTAASGLVLALWVTLTTLQGVYARVSNKQQPFRALAGIPRGFYGMTLGHLGIAVFIVGVTLTNVYTVERDIQMAPGDRQEIAGYMFQFEGVRQVQGPNYVAQQGRMPVYRGKDLVATLTPEKRVYRVDKNPMTEAGIDPGLTRDLYVSLGEPLGQNSWSVRLHYKAFIRWIWLGALFMAIGAGIAASDRRYRRLAQRSEATEPVAGSTVGAAS